MLVLAMRRSIPSGDTNTFAAAALMGLSALAAAIHAGSRNEALDSQDTE